MRYEGRTGISCRKDVFSESKLNRVISEPATFVLKQIVFMLCRAAVRHAVPGLESAIDFAFYDPT